MALVRGILEIPHRRDLAAAGLPPPRVWAAETSGAEHGNAMVPPNNKRRGESCPALCFFAATGLSCLLAASPPVSAVGSEEAALFRALRCGYPSRRPAGLDEALAAEPNHVGSPHDKANAEWILAQFQILGLGRAHRIVRRALSTPIHEALEMVSPRPFKAMLQEPPIPGDSSRAREGARPARLFAYQGDGDVRANSSM